jgi:hypothetical protein
MFHFFSAAATMEDLRAVGPKGILFVKVLTG